MSKSKPRSGSSINKTRQTAKDQRGKAGRIGEGRTGPVGLAKGRQHTDSPRSEPSQRTPAHGRDRRGKKK